MEAIAAGWQGGVRACVYDSEGTDFADVSLTQWQGCGSNVLLYRGPVGGPGYGGENDNPTLGEKVNERMWVELVGTNVKVVEIFKVLMATLHPYQLCALQEKLSHVGIEV
jgi:hypothetical protein